jgi:peptidoglycan L-alanyl-D-glutamate endopeptidase CwlK
MDKITFERIELMHPKLRKSLRDQYGVINNKLPRGVRLRFSHTLRTVAEQNALFQMGRTAPGSIVTNAKGGQSIHNYGLAFDIVILLDKDNNGTFETAVWNGKFFNQVVAFFKAEGWEWGGDWKFKDNPHFQYKKDNGQSYNWRELMNSQKDKDNYPII